MGLRQMGEVKGSILKHTEGMTIEGESGLVYPAAPSIGELSKPIEEYFPCSIDEWYSHGETWKKRMHAQKYGDTCVVSGQDLADCHEIYPQGAGERQFTLVPHNMIRANSHVHRLLQSHTWTVLHWDPLAYPDPEGLVIIDSEGKRVSLWWNLNLYERAKRRYRP